MLSKSLLRPFLEHDLQYIFFRFISPSLPCVTLNNTPSISSYTKMASILSLPDDCLHKIVSFIEDPSSFYNIILTCQRFLQVTKNRRSVLHSNLLRAKADYAIKCRIVQKRSALEDDRCADGRHLAALLEECARLTTTKNTLTYDKVVDVWQSNGPVAAKLFTWVRNFLETHPSKYQGYVKQTNFSKERSITLHLPSCERTMVIQTWHFGDYKNEIVPSLRIQITCGDLTVKSEGFSRSLREEYLSWKLDEIKRAVKPMKEVVELLQKELGKTIPPITDDFFLWLCCFFPDKANLTEGNMLRFKDDTRNTKPTHATVQTAIAEFHKELQFENSLEKLLTMWNTQAAVGKFKWEQYKYLQMITETIRQLSNRSETKILERLGEDASRFYRMVDYPDLRKLPNKVLLNLFSRTLLEASTFKPATVANENVESRVFFKCLGSKVMKVCGSIHRDGNLIPSWELLHLEFTLPDGKVLKLDAPLDLEILSPVKDLLQECFNSTMQGEQTEIDNFFTAFYFFNALELSSGSHFASKRLSTLQEPPDIWDYDDYSPLQRFPESDEEEVDWPDSEYDYFFNK